MRAAAVLALMLGGAAMAAPPEGADPNSALGRWLRSLRNVHGYGCCDTADCRRTMVRLGDAGGVEAWIGRDEYGPGAPDAWMVVPAIEVRSREDRPVGVRGAWVCFYGGRVACADLEGGT